MAARWPAPRMTTRQKIVAMEEMRILGGMTPKQRELWRMKR
jgi:hypothetical protein